MVNARASAGRRRCRASGNCNWAIAQASVCWTGYENKGTEGRRALRTGQGAEVHRTGLGGSRQARSCRGRHRRGAGGGFYHNFASRDELLERLLAAWEVDCRFLPPEQPGNSPPEAVAWLDRTVDRLIEEDGYDPHFDMAVREWARSDQRAAWAVERRDRNRLARLQRFFAILGYGPDEAVMRARVFYFHQIGFYAIGVKASTADRRRDAKLYTDVLCGDQVLQSARGSSPPRRSKARSGS
jgi:hypothetical protein